VFIADTLMTVNWLKCKNLRQMSKERIGKAMRYVKTMMMRGMIRYVEIFVEKTWLEGQVLSADYISV